MPEPQLRLDARATLRRRMPSTRRYNGSGAERRATIGDPRSGPLLPHASARATGYTYRSQVFRGPLTGTHSMAASATTSEGYTKRQNWQPRLEPG